MKKMIFSRKGAISSFLLCSMTLAAPEVRAQTTTNVSTSVIAAVNSLRASIDAIVTTAATYIFQTPPNVGSELVGNYTQYNAAQTIAPNVLTLNNNDIQNGLAPNVQNPNQNLVQLATIQAVDTVIPSLTLSGLPIPFFSSASQNSLQNALVQGNQNFNFQSLMMPPQNNYTTEQLQSYALNYIHFLAGFGTPISNINLNSYTSSQLSTTQKILLQNSASYQAYSVQRRQILALQSAALTNLYAIYQRRLPIATINASDTPLGVNSPSFSQIEQYNSTWRTSSPSWYTQMATASQTNVEREMLFVLAEIQVQLHRMQLDNERMVALQSVSLLTTLQTAKQALLLSEKQVQNTINATIQQNSKQGTTSGATTTTNPTAPSTSNTTTQTNKLQQAEQQVKSAQQQASQQQNATQQANSP